MSFIHLFIEHLFIQLLFCLYVLFNFITKIGMSYICQSIALFSHSAAKVAIIIQAPSVNLIRDEMWKIGHQTQEMHRLSITWHFDFFLFVKSVFLFGTFTNNKKNTVQSRSTILWQLLNMSVPEINDFAELI